MGHFFCAGPQEPDQGQNRSQPEELDSDAKQKISGDREQVGWRLDPGSLPGLASQDHVDRASNRLGVAPIEPGIGAGAKGKVQIRYEP